MALNYYVGWTGEPWRTELLPVPSAPSNYKDPAKISAYVEDKRVKQQHSAGKFPIYGRLASVFVCDDSGEEVFFRTTDDLASAGDRRTAGLAFLEWLRSTFIFPEDPACTELWSATGGGTTTAKLVGLDVKVALKMAVMEGFVHADTRVAPSAIPRRMWHLNQADDFCADPFEMIRKGVPDLTLAAVLRFFNIEVPQAKDSPDASEWAAIVRSLAIATGLAGEGARGRSNEDAVRAAYPITQQSSL